MADLLINEPVKVCTRCLKSKPLTTEFFSARSDARCGFVSRCKLCVAEIGRIRWTDPEHLARENAKRAVRYANPDFQNRERARQERRKANPLHVESEKARQKRRKASPEFQQKERERSSRRRSDSAYQDKMRSYQKKWYAANAEQRSKITRSWYESNKERLRAHRNSPEIRSRSNKWTREHLKKNPHLKVIRSVGSAIAEILKCGRTSGAFRFLPYTKAELRAHLERQFVRGMNWENYGSAWHVDHIVPQSSFKIDPIDPANCPEFQACWALPNLRPLWKRDNLAKNGRRIHLL